MGSAPNADHRILTTNHAPIHVREGRFTRVSCTLVQKSVAWLSFGTIEVIGSRRIAVAVGERGCDPTGRETAP